MLCCICIYRPIIENDGMSYEANLAFHDEQPLQEGKRIFEEVLNNLARHGELDGDILSWGEFWGVFQRLSDILNQMIPGTFYIRWTLKEFSCLDKQALELGNIVRAAQTAAIAPPDSASPTSAASLKAPSRREVSTPPTGPSPSRSTYSPPGTAGSPPGTAGSGGRLAAPGAKAPVALSEAERFRRGVTKRYR